MSDLGGSTRNTSVNFDPSNLENFQAPSVDPLPRSDMNLCELREAIGGVVFPQTTPTPFVPLEKPMEVARCACITAQLQL